MTTLRRSVKRALVVTRLDDPLLRVRRQLASPGTRRNYRDMANLRLLLRMVLQPDDCCIDVGANRGQLLEEFVRLCPAGRHLAFEPVPVLAEALQAQFPAVEVHPWALGDAESERPFHWIVSQPGLSSFAARPARPPAQVITVRTRRLDDVVEPSFRPRLIKIDVEGAELQVLRGAAETLRRDRPLVVFEHGRGDAEQDPGSSGELWDLLDSAGLAVFDLDGTGPYGRDQLIAEHDEGTHYNFLARPYSTANGAGAAT